MCSGAHPAITPLTATLHTVASCPAGNSTPSTSLGWRSVLPRKACTRSWVGGTIGSPSVQDRSRKWSWISSSEPRNTI